VGKTIGGRFRAEYSDWNSAPETKLLIDLSSKSELAPSEPEGNAADQTYIAGTKTLQPAQIASVISNLAYGK